MSSQSKLTLLLLACLLFTIQAATLVPWLSTKQQHQQHIPVAALKKKEQQSSSSTTTTSLLTIIRGGGGGGGSDDHKDHAWMEGLKSSLASALAAACSKTILAPFDTIKTIQQHNLSPNGGALGFFPACHLIMSRPQGFWELYAGLGVSVLGAMPSVGLYFGVYSYCKRTIYPMLQQAFGENNNNFLSDSVLWTVSIAASAAVGNTVASFSRVPYEVVKQNLQTGVYQTTFQAIREMARASGWRAFFPMGGVSIQMMRDIPYAMVTLLSYEYLKHSFVRPYRERHHEQTTKTSAAWCDMVAGAVAGGIGSYVTNPLDVLKTRLQTDSSLYKGSIAMCARATWEEGGAMAFLRGSVPRLFHKIPANGAFFLFYELFGRLLHVEGVGKE
jgi:Mitochondrial carrier protein